VKEVGSDHPDHNTDFSMAIHREKWGRKMHNFKNSLFSFMRFSGRSIHCFFPELLFLGLSILMVITISYHVNDLFGSSSFQELLLPKVSAVTYVLPAMNIYFISTLWLAESQILLVTL